MFLRNLLLGSSFFGTFAQFFATIHARTETREPRISIDVETSEPPIPLLQHTIFRRDPDPTKNQFLEPQPFGIPGDFSNDTTWIIGDQTIEVSWISEWQSVDLSVCQPTAGSSVGCYTVIRGTLSKGYHWEVDNVTDHMTGFASQPIPNVYFFQLTQTNTLNPAIMSHYFNIKTDDNDTSAAGNGSGSTTVTGNTTSSSLPSSGSQAPSTSNVTSASSTSATAASNTAAGDASSSQLSTQAQIAIFVVAGMVASGLLVAGGFWIVLRRRKSKRAARLAKISIEDSTLTLASPIPLQEVHAESHVHETGKALPHEIASREIPMELPAEVPGLAISRYEEDEWWDEASVDDRSIYSRQSQSHEATR